MTAKTPAEAGMPEVLDHDGFNPTPENYATTANLGNPFREIDTSIRDEDDSPMSMKIDDIVAHVEAEIAETQSAELKATMAEAFKEAPQVMADGNEVVIKSDEQAGQESSDEPEQDADESATTAGRRLGHLPNVNGSRRKQ